MVWSFGNNADLRTFLSYLKEGAISRNLSEASLALAYVLENTWTTSSEFLGEARLALDGIRGDVEVHFDKDDYEALLNAISAIESAFRSRG